METLANLAQILGVFGIIASLIYVGRQVQQNTLQMKVEARGNHLQVFIHFWHRIANDREFATLWHKGGSEYFTLDEIDQLRLQSFATSGLMVWSYLYELHQADLLSEHQWKEQLGDMERIGQRAVTREAWNLNKERFGEPFRQFLEQYVE